METASIAGSPVIASAAVELEVIATVTNVEDAVSAMAAYAQRGAPGDAGSRRIAVGTSDPGTEKLGDLLVDQIGGPAVDLVRYRVGPSVGAHMGPGTAGLFVC